VLTLHIANKNYSSWSLRPWLLLRELGIAFEERMHWFDGGEDFASFSPSAKVPCLVDDSGAGERVIWDSLAIVETVYEDHPAVWPSDPVARAWARSAAAEMHSGFAALRSTCSMNCGVRVRLHGIDDALARDLARLEAVWADGLARFGGPWLAGSAFTAVDAFFAPVAFRALGYGLELRPDSQAYVDRLLALPGMREWYDAGLAETRRDPSHDAELERVGVITADLRHST
jgi:glutathione S-transferase